MPSKTNKQHGFMGMSSNPRGRAKLRAHGKKPAPMSVAKEFVRADSGKAVAKRPGKRKKRR